MGPTDTRTFRTGVTCLSICRPMWRWLIMNELRGVESALRLCREREALNIGTHHPIRACVSSIVIILSVLAA